MAGQPLAAKILEGALDWVKRLPEALSADVAVDVGRKRVRLSHARVEALTRQVLRNVKALELHAWESGPRVYDVRLTVSGWRLRVEATLERVELASGRYKLWLRTPGKVELEQAAAGLGTADGRAAGGSGAGRRCGPWRRSCCRRACAGTARCWRWKARLPKEGVDLRRGSSSPPHWRMSAEHCAEGLWLSAEAWPGLMDLLQAALGTS